MNICVYCGSKAGDDPAFAQTAKRLGTWIAGAGHALVYGGGGVGLMDAVASAALVGGAHVIGVIPQFLVDAEELKDGLPEVHVTQTMAERKALMVELSDAFVALPGGPGTIEELSEVLSLLKLGKIDAPLVLLDVDGYYDALARAYDVQVEHGFSTPAERAHLQTARSVEELEALLGDWQKSRA